MLDASNDPIGDFINAASSDTIAFCAGLSYETFLNETAKCVVCRVIVTRMSMIVSLA